MHTNVIVTEYVKYQRIYNRLRELHDNASPRGFIMDYIHPNKFYDMLATPTQQTATKYYKELIRLSASQGWAGHKPQPRLDLQEVRDLYYEAECSATILTAWGADLSLVFAET